MIQLCKHLTDAGLCHIKAHSNEGELVCPAVELFVNKIESINYSLMQQMACSDRWEAARMGIKFEYEADIQLAPELSPIDTRERYTPTGTHPDPETHHCQECGLLYPNEDWCFEYGTCKKCAEHLDFKELKRMVAEAKKAEPPLRDEKPELQFTQIHGNVLAAISGESVHLKYGNSKCGIWDRTIFDTLLEMNEDERRKEIESLVEGMSSKLQRKSCLRQFVIALGKGEVSFPAVV